MVWETSVFERGWGKRTTLPFHHDMFSKTVLMDLFFSDWKGGF
jgi:hypothetical protein